MMKVGHAGAADETVASCWLEIRNLLVPATRVQAAVKKTANKSARTSGKQTMNVMYACSQCDAPLRQDLTPAATTLVCPHCSAEMTVPAGAVKEEQVSRCVVCPSTELFVRKNFPQQLGVLIVVVGITASCIPWYYKNVFWTFAILFVTALIDLVLYLFVGNLLECYRCHAQYRGVSGLEGHAPFDLETHERYRQQAARLAESAPKSAP